MLPIIGIPVLPWRTVCAVCLCAVSHLAFAAYPERPLRLVAPFAPGGNIDITARTVAPGLSEQLGQPVVVENRGGAGGRIGVEAVAKSAPDGYTLLLAGTGTLTIHPAFSTRPAYDPLKDFAPTSMVSVVPMVMVVHPSLPARTTQAFIALARAQPRSILMASAGTGSYTHLTGELFQLATGVKLTHVPYKGTAPALVDLVSGQTHCLFDQVSTSTPHIRAGKLRAIAVTTQRRSSLLQGVPTMAEAGVRDFEAATYTGVFLPGATPRDIVQRVYASLVKVLDQPATHEAFARLGAEVVKSTPEQWVRRLRDDLAKWKKLKARTGIKLQ